MPRTSTRLFWPWYRQRSARDEGISPATLSRRWRGEQQSATEIQPNHWVLNAAYCIGLRTRGEPHETELDPAISPLSYPGALKRGTPHFSRVDNMMLQQPGGASAQPFLAAQARAPARHTLTVRAVVAGAADPAQPADEVSEQKEPLFRGDVSGEAMRVLGIFGAAVRNARPRTRASRSLCSPCCGSRSSSGA